MVHSRASVLPGKRLDDDTPDTVLAGKRTLAELLADDPIDLGLLATVTVTAEPEPIQTEPAQLSTEIQPRPLIPLPRLELGDGSRSVEVDPDDDADAIEVGELATVTVTAEPEPIDAEPAQVSTEIQPRPIDGDGEAEATTPDDERQTQQDLQLTDAVPEGRLPTNGNGRRRKPTISGDKIGALRITSAFDERGAPHSFKHASGVINADGRLVKRPPGRRNLGIDYVPVGTKQIHAWFPGTVKRVVTGQKDGTAGGKGYGNRAVVLTDLFYKLDGQYHQVWCHYAHCANVAVELDQRVSAGDVIGTYGNTGGSHGAHVDFRTWILTREQGKVDISPNLLVTRKSAAKRTSPTERTPTQKKPVAAKQGSLKLGANETYREALLLAQQRTGIDAAALAAVIDAEAGKVGQRWSPGSKAPGSTAVGLTQFTIGTWLVMARTPGTLLSERALERGLVQRAGKHLSIVDQPTLLALRTDPTLSIVSAAEYGVMNLRAMTADHVVPAGLTDDQRAHFMYIGHHEGSAGAVIHYTDSASCSEEQATTALGNFKAGRALRKLYSTAREAYRVFAERFSRGKFPAQVKGSRLAGAIIQRYLDAHGGSWEHAYRAWLRDYADRKIQPDRFRDAH
jgi:murein DD-endopeptidase MepM/ murein hydrolase activator NlpD